MQNVTYDMNMDETASKQSSLNSIESRMIANKEMSSSNRCLLQHKYQTRWTIRLLVSIIATFVCIYQIYLVLLLYYSYPTNVDVRFDQSPYVRLPGVTICSELSSTILFDRMYSISPQIYKLFIGRNSIYKLYIIISRLVINTIFCVGKTRQQRRALLESNQVKQLLLNTLHMFSISEQHQLTVKADQFFYQCQLPFKYNFNRKMNLYPSFMEVRGSGAINCSQFSEIVETISYNMKCFTLFMNHTIDSETRQFSYEILRDVAANFKYLVLMQINREYISNGYIYLHAPDISHQYSSARAVIPLDSNLNQQVSLAYDRELFRLLPPPYQTSCHDYRHDGFQCREDCMTKCKVSRYLLNGLGWPGDVFANVNVTQYFSNIWINAHSMTGTLEAGMNANSLATCSVQCGLHSDCDRIQYNVRNIKQTQRDTNDDHTTRLFTIGLLLPKDVQLIIKHVPKFQFVQFFVSLIN
ncbi:hypothetical protein RDWZM_008572 [Blomia tropicalis]|uniref:Uncharacterized protein n=1 Tax=Blomia tropicalis TaxID=40697 RepID=A0A9Q0M4S2_BLOTA|nr:hypothetical protein RDWZM_008572 [Blomia tropicalis]